MLSSYDSELLQLLVFLPEQFELAKDDDDNYLLTTGPDGTVVIRTILSRS